MSREVKHVSRGRYLTPEERAKYRRIREQVEGEKPEITARIRSRMAAQRAIDQVFDQLKKARQDKGLSLTDLQNLTGMDRSAISKLENGQRDNFTIDTVARYAHAVGKKLVISLAEA